MKFVFLIIFCLMFSGCNFTSSFEVLNSMKSTNILPPAAIEQISPPTNSDPLATPSFRIPDVIAGDIVKLYDDVTCATEVGSAVSAGTTVSITVSSLSIGIHQVRARITRAGLTSSCSAVLVTYTVTAPACANYSASPLSSLISSEPTMAGQSVAADGNYSYLGTSSGGTNTGIQIVDVSNPAAPVNVSYVPTYTGAGQIDAAANDILDIALDGNTLYASTLSGGLLIVDVTNKAAPVIKSGLDLTGETWSVGKKGNYAYVGGWNVGLHVVDISNPNAPALVTTVASMTLRHIQIEGNRIYGAAHDKIQVIDISNPIAPSLLGEIVVGVNNAYEGYYANGYFYAIEKAARNIKTYDVSNPAAITLVNTFADVGGNDLRSIDGVGDKLFIGTGSNASGQVRAYSLATPSAPSFLGATALTQRSYEIKYDSGKVYSANLDGKIEIVQVCGP